MKRTIATAGETTTETVTFSPAFEKLPACVVREDEDLYPEVDGRDMTGLDVTGVPLSKDAQRAVGGKRAKHEAAYRRRMYMVGVLSSCICCWPNETELTSTGHHEACPAHLMLSGRRA